MTVLDGGDRRNARGPDWNHRYTFPFGATIAFGYMAVGLERDSYRKLIEVSFSGERAHREKNAQDSSLRAE